MEMKQPLFFSKEVDGRVYMFLLPNNAPAKEAFDVYCEAMESVLSIAKSNQERMQEQMNNVNGDIQAMEAQFQESKSQNDPEKGN